jgi:hypothetical protein
MIRGVKRLHPNGYVLPLVTRNACLSQHFLFSPGVEVRGRYNVAPTFMRCQRHHNTTKTTI